MQVLVFVPALFLVEEDSLGGNGEAERGREMEVGGSGQRWVARVTARRATAGVMFCIFLKESIAADLHVCVTISGTLSAKLVLDPQVSALETH